MNNKNYASITILFAVILMPQLFFWWLAPQTADSYLAVFGCGTFLTLAVPAVCFAVYVASNIRESAGMIVVAGVLELVTIAVSVCLLAFNASVRTTLFVFGIDLLLDLLAIVPFVYSILRKRGWQADGYEPELIYQTKTDRMAVPDRSSRPLPPRN